MRTAGAENAQMNVTPQNSVELNLWPNACSHFQVERSARTTLMGDRILLIRAILTV